MTLTVFAPAKINLSLKILGKRPDGYHDLESLITFADFGDQLTLEEGKGFALNVEGPFAAVVPKQNDLASKAIHLLANEVGRQPDVHIHLTKNMPAGAGMGGGSADAAAALRGVNTLWNLGKSTEELARLALPLGSDLPACLYGEEAGVLLKVTGRGEHVEKKTGHKTPLVLLWPDVHIATQKAFGALTLPTDAQHKNDFEPWAVETYPVVKEALTALKAQRGCRQAQLNGSGSSVFGLFNTQEEAKLALKVILRSHPNWWGRAGWCGLV